MENTLTKKQAEAMLMVCRQWCDHVCMITDERTTDYSEWRDKLQSISYRYTLPVNIRDMYSAMIELNVELANKIESGEFI